MTSWSILLEEKKKKAKHILAGDVSSIINPTVKDTSVVLLVSFTIFTLPLSVHKRKLPAPLTFWSSSLVQGPFTSSGLSTFCQRCWHWPSVLPWNTATQSGTHHSRTLLTFLSPLPTPCAAVRNAECKLGQIHTGKWQAIDFQESVPCCSTSFLSFSSWKGGKENMSAYTILHCHEDACST